MNLMSGVSRFSHLGTARTAVVAPAAAAAAEPERNPILAPGQASAPALQPRAAEDDDDDKEKKDKEAKRKKAEEDEKKKKDEDDEKDKDAKAKKAEEDKKKKEDDDEDGDDEGDRADAGDPMRRKARARERARISAIMCSDVGKTYPAAAAHFALDTDLPRRQAIASISALATMIPAPAAPAPGAARDSLRDRMETVQQPQVGGSGAGGGPANDDQKAAAAIVAAGKWRRGEKA
jgi:hypothetical protein